MTRTPTEVIASVEQWASHIITQPNDPMRKDVAAVLAMAEWASGYVNGLGIPSVQRAAEQKLRTALSAAGVGGGE